MLIIRNCSLSISFRYSIRNMAYIIEVIEFSIHSLLLKLSSHYIWYKTWNHLLIIQHLMLVFHIFLLIICLYLYNYIYMFLYMFIILFIYFWLYIINTYSYCNILVLRRIQYRYYRYNHLIIIISIIVH